MKEITCSRGVEWGDVCLAQFSYNYNIRDKVYLRNGVTEYLSSWKRAAHVKNRNTRTRGNKRFLLLLSFLFLSWSPTFIPGLSPPFFPLFHGRKNYLRVSIDEIERDSLRRFSSPGQFVVYREKSWIVSRAISSIKRRTQPRLITPITV